MIENNSKKNDGLILLIILIFYLITLKTLFVVYLIFPLIVFYYSKSKLLLLKNKIFIIMGRPKKSIEEKKVKVSSSLDKDLYNKIKTDNFKPSRMIEKLVRDYYGNQSL